MFYFLLQIIRRGAEDPTVFCIDYVFDGQIVHKLIENTTDGFRLEGSTLNFHSIAALVAHYLVLEGDDLSCSLRRPAAQHRPFDSLTSSEQLKYLRRLNQAPMVVPRPSNTDEPALWNQIGVAKSEALQVLLNQPEGAFVIRTSESVANRFELFPSICS